MSKLRIAYLVSLAMLAALMALAAFRPMSAEREYSEVLRQGVLKGNGEWLVQLEMVNHEGRTVDYVVDALVAGKHNDVRFSVRDGFVYRYVHQIPYDSLGSGRATFTIYKDGETAPFDTFSYYLDQS